MITRMKIRIPGITVRHGFYVLFALPSLLSAQVIIGTGSTGQSNIPIYTLYEYTASEIIYLGSEINTTGNITEIGFNKVSGTSTATTSNVTIYMKATSAATVNATTSLTDYTPVWSGTFPNSASGWQSVTLGTPFAFTSTSSNLSILIVNNSNDFIGSGRPNWAYVSTSSNYRASYYSSSNTPWSASSSMTRTYSRPNIRISVSAAVSCSAATFPTAVSAQASKTSICSEESVAFNLSAPMPSATGITYQWKSSADNVTYTNAGSASSAPTATMTAGAAAKWFKCEVLCNGTAVLTSSPVEISLQVALLSTTAGSRCGTGAVTLGATAASGNTIRWYSASSGGTPAGTGNTFTTPSLSATTTYYAAASGGGSTASVGVPSPGTISNLGSTNNGEAMIFNVAQATSLQSVTIYPLDAGTNNKIILKNASGTVLQSLTFTITSTQANSSGSVQGTPMVIALNWAIPAGTGYQLQWDNPGGYISNRVLRNLGGATAYYNAANASGVTFTGNTGSGLSYWFYFYDWVFSSSCESPRMPVTATINAAPAGGTVSSDQHSCIYGTPQALTLTGNAGSVVRWQSALSSDFAAPVDINTASATLSSEKMGALTQTTYYRAITESGGCTSSSGKAVVTVDPYPTQISAADNSSTPCTILGPDHWAVLVAPDNTIIACVNDAAGGNDLGSMHADVRLAGNVQEHQGIPYMQRVVTIAPQNNGPAGVRLFFTESELNALKAADPSLVSVSQLIVTKFAGTSVSGTGEHITPATISTAAETGMPGVYALDIPVTGFSTFIIHRSHSVPLPVGLSDFTVKNVSNRYAEIRWSTHSETGNDYFAVERSVDGKKFVEVEKVKGAGNSSKWLKYEAFDPDPHDGVSYYRLRQVDFDGKFSYSEVRSLYFDRGTTALTLSPNPAKEGTSLAFRSEIEGKVRIDIYNMTGQLAESLTETMHTGSNACLVGRSLSPGIYEVVVTAGQALQGRLKLVIAD